MHKRLKSVLAAALVAASLAACSGDGSFAVQQSNLPMLGELWQMVQNSTEPDSDGDYLPDDVERLVGTDPADRDSDRDGLTDNYEIFGDGYYQPDDFVADEDGDGFVAPIDADDDGDGRNDGEVIDTDGDGVPNYLEYYGYTYDWLTGRFRAWNGDPSVQHWLTDPTQRSTDQDAFPDGMEASGAVMDVAVQGPGDDPLVAAYPNIVVQLMSYAVTLNQDITYTDGGSLAKGSTWNRETTQTSSRSTERNWEIGVESSLTVGTTGVSGTLTYHANYGESYTNTQTTSTAVSVGGSVLDESNWSRARTMNPTEAAAIKLCLKVHNLGTACASNIIPTLTLRIGGINVATFEPGNAQINMLVPGGTYPADPGVYWVVDSIDTGTGVTPLVLTLNELRALERGAPVSLTVTQLLADVMLSDDAAGWTSAGDCNEYLARCDAVGANLRVEVGDGDFVHYLVYADDAPSAPRVTFADALRRIGMREDAMLAYNDMEGEPKLASLEGYTFVFDRDTLVSNGWDLETAPATPPSSGFKIGDMVLGPRTSVFVKAPRDLSDSGPAIHYANADPQTHEVQICVSDYQGIEMVTFVDKDGQPFEDEDGEPLMLIEEIPDSGFFYVLVPDPDYAFEGTEKVIVRNLANQVAERAVNLVYYEEPPQPENPLFNAIQLDISASPPRLYANVSSPNLMFPIQWVKVFHSQLSGGVLELGEPVNVYEDPDGWVVDLEQGWEYTNLKLVAYVAPGVYTEVLLSDEQVTNAVVTSGTVTLYGEFDWTGTDEWITETMDFDSGARYRTGWKTSAYKYSSPWDITHWCTAASSSMWRLNFANPYALSGEEFGDTDPDYIAYRLTSSYLTDAGDTKYAKDDIFVFETEEGHLVKMKVTNWSDDSSGWPYEWRYRKLTFQYVVYEKPTLP